MNRHHVGLSFSIVVLALLTGCAPEMYRIAVAPSLQPVDTARTRVVFSQVRGEACGRDAVAGALRDLDRFDDADGFVEVIMEGIGDGDERCVRAVGKPFRYGTSTEALTLRAGDPPADPVVIPGRNAPAPLTSFCPGECRRVTELLGVGSMATELEYQRCMSRCELPDSGFRGCIESASTPVSAKACFDSASDAGPGEDGASEVGANEGETSNDGADPGADEESPATN